MIVIEIPPTEFFDESTETFESVRGCSLKLEHSLLSVSKWESRWKKPFLDVKGKTEEETLDYVRCMTLNPPQNDSVYYAIPNEEIERIGSYIETDQTATWFNESKNAPPNRQIVTSELIYYWMVSCGIPFECQKWHLSRLMTLIRICQVKNSPDKKMSQRDIFAQNSKLNAARRAARRSRG